MYDMKKLEHILMLTESKRCATALCRLEKTLLEFISFVSLTTSHTKSHQVVLLLKEQTEDYKGRVTMLERKMLLIVERYYIPVYRGMLAISKNQIVKNFMH